MRLFFRYLYEKRWIYGMFILFIGIFFLCFRLFRLPAEAFLYPALLCTVCGAGAAVCGFLRVRRRHRELLQVRCIADIPDQELPVPAGIVEADLQEILRLLAQEHRQARQLAEGRCADMVDYYTVWAHQIKTPIASMRLTLQNEDSALSRQLTSDLHRIEQYVEMVLTFLRLDADSTDYVIREYPLDPIIRQAVKRFSHEFIQRRLRLDYVPTAARVITDEKWLLFVIEQLLSNALKYTREGVITIRCDADRFTVRDTGLGIAPEDLPRIFENGFTGAAGRMDKRASGIGLYLCRRICENLGHRISAASQVGEGTVVTVELARTRVEVE